MVFDRPDGVSIALYHVQGFFCAVENQCPHEGANLAAEGEVEGFSLCCPWHGACFDLRSGAVLAPPAERPLRTFPVWITDGEVRVAID